MTSDSGYNKGYNISFQNALFTIFYPAKWHKKRGCINRNLLIFRAESET